MAERRPKYHIASFSGGKDSTAMVLHMIELGYPLDEVIFCDTSVEFPDMYEHIEKVKAVIESNGIKFTTLKYKFTFKELLADCDDRKVKQSTIDTLGFKPKGYGWSNMRVRWCTELLKRGVVSPYKTKLSKTYDVIEYVGLAYDELHRVKGKNLKHRHPLIEWEWTEAMCLQYCYDKGYDWNGLYNKFSRVSCWCCPLKAIADYRTLYTDYPELWEELKELDSLAWNKFLKLWTVDQLEARFKLEFERIEQGLTINPRTKEFRLALAERLKEVTI